MSQLALPLPPPMTLLSRADFLVSDSNRAGLGWIDRWPLWPSPAFVLYGPAECGKSHLARLWCARAGAALISGAALSEDLALDPHASIAVDGAERAPERALLHLYNRCFERGTSLLLTARRPPATWPIALADLRSRLCAAGAAGIGMPDDALLSAVLVKHFADRELSVAPPVIAYLVTRIERSFAAAASAAAKIDGASLAARRPVTVALVRQVMGWSAVQAPPGSESAVT